MKNTSSLRLFVVSLAVLPLFAGCSTSLSVDSEWNREADFSQFKSYAWIPQDRGPSGDQQLPKHLDLRLRRVVDDILIDEKGFDKAPSPADADFLLAYYINTQKKLRVNYSVYGGYYGGYRYGHWPGYYGGSAAHNVREYTTGTLVLDVVDRTTKTLAWTGVVAGEAKYENPSGERVTKVMTEVLANFPPPDSD
jgi:hypothetical protein